MNEPATPFSNARKILDDTGGEWFIIADVDGSRFSDFYCGW